MADKARWLDALAADGEERVLLASLMDRYQRMDQRQYLTASHFLDLGQQALAQRAFSFTRGEGFVLWGGYEQAERKMAVFYPPYLTREEACRQLPAAVIRVQRAGLTPLSHRDYLGALLSTGVRREMVGDILVEEDGADILLCEELAEYVLGQLQRAGRQRLEGRQVPLDQLRQIEQKFALLRDTVPALRLDCIVAAGFSLSRGESQRAVSAGRVLVNQRPVEKADARVNPGDQITLRGRGRIRLESAGGQSRKGRMFVEIKKWM